MEKELEGNVMMRKKKTKFSIHRKVNDGCFGFNVLFKFFYREYGDFNLDELCEGDRIGMVRKGETGSLHFFINGLDQGVAATRVPSQIWGVVDLYGMTVKV